MPMPMPSEPMTSDALLDGSMVEPLAQALLRRGWRLATAESCTGGLIAAACTALAGSSRWFERGFVTYSNEAKVALLGVDAALIDAHGAVSEPVACAMAEGALQRAGAAGADLAVAVTGIAGPDGAVPGKPVGTVWIGLARAGQPPRACRLQLDGDRAAVRQATVRQALALLREIAEADAAVDAVVATPKASPAVAGQGVGDAGAPRQAAPVRVVPMRVAVAMGEAVADRGDWIQALCEASPDVQWVTRFQPGDAFDAAVVAQPPPGALNGLQGLGLVQSLWAGVDRLLKDPTLPPEVPLSRMVDPAMTAAMVESAAWAVLSLHRGFFTYAQQQRDGLWRQHPQRRAAEVPVTVLGYGVMGQAVAARLAALGYPVVAWRRGSGDMALAGLATATASVTATAADAGPGAAPALPGAGLPAVPLGPPAVQLLAGPADLPRALASAQVVVNLLPLTPDTAGLLGERGLAPLPRGAAIVNFGRGGHMVEAELLAMLDDGRLGHAVLDVFPEEPLPAAHRFWSHPRVTVLPHVAALTDLRSAAQVVADNLRRLAEGLPLQHLVDRRRGY